MKEEAFILLLQRSMRDCVEQDCLIVNTNSSSSDVMVIGASRITRSKQIY